jgi:2-C-methyl-D-erythritol 4-phosphate cytidylyltransferase
MISAIIVAGGKGIRMGQDINKQFIKLKDKEVLALTIEAFSKVEVVDEIIVVISEEEKEFCIKHIIDKYKFNKVKKVVAGGKERQESVYNGLINCNKNCEIVLIHDGARPFVTSKMIEESVACAKVFGACTVGIPVKDTIKVITTDNMIASTLKRDELFAVQTPQTFDYKLILEAHEYARNNNLVGTDDTVLIEMMDRNVKVVLGSYLNIKLTTPEDLIFGRAILENKELVDK